MVDIGEYQQALQQRRGALEEAKQKAQQSQFEISQIQLRGTSPIQRQMATKQFEESKAQVLAQIEPQIAEQERLEKEFGEYQTQKAAYDEAMEYQRQFEFGRSQAGGKYGALGAGLDTEAAKEGYAAGKAGISFAEGETQRVKETKQWIEDFEKNVGGKVELEKGLNAVIKTITLPGQSPMSVEEFNKSIEELPTPQQNALLEKYGLGELPETNRWEMIKPPSQTFGGWVSQLGSSISKNIQLRPLSPFPIQITPSGLYEVAKEVQAPQSFIAERTTVAQLEKIPVVQQILDIERAYRKEYPAPDPFGIGRISFVGEKLGKAYSDVGTSLIIRPIEKQVRKLPYETRLAISQFPSKLTGPSSALYETFPLRKPIQAGIKFMQIVPSPQKVLGTYIAKKVPQEKLAPFQLIEREYLKEVKEGREPGRTKFFIEKLGEGYSQAFTGLGETYFQAKEGRYVSPFVKTKYPQYTYLTESRIVGGVGRAIGMGQLYVVPVVGKTLFAAPFVEAAGRRELGSYIKKHPFETALTTAILVAPVVKYLKEPIIKEGWKTKPKETLKGAGELATAIDEQGKVKYFYRYGIKETFAPGKYYRYTQPRYMQWLGDITGKGLETSGQVLKATPTQLKSAGIVLDIKKVQPQTRIIKAKWFDIKKPYTAEEFVGGRKIPNLNRVIAGKDKTVLIGWSDKKIRAFKPNIVESTKFKTIASEGKLDVFIGDKSKNLLVSRSRKLGETELYRLVRERVDIAKITPKGNIKLPPGRELEMFTKVYKTPVKEVTVYTIPPPKNEFMVIAIKKSTKVTKPFAWMGTTTSTSLTPMATGEVTSQQLINVAEATKNIIPKLKTIPKVIPITITTIPKVTQIVKLDVVGKTLVTTSTLLKVIPKEIASEKAIEKSVVSTKLKQIPKQIVFAATTPTQKQVTAQATSLAQISKVALTQIIKPQLVISQAPRFPKKPTITTITPFAFEEIPYTPPKRKIPEVFQQPKAQRYIAFGRRYGKFKPVSEPTTLERAKRKGIKFLKVGLGATIEVRTPKGERKKIGKESRFFRPAKKDVYQLVQKKIYRLGTIGERREIIRARKGVKFIK